MPTRPRLSSKPLTTIEAIALVLMFGSVMSVAWWYAQKHLTASPETAAQPPVAAPTAAPCPSTPKPSASPNTITINLDFRQASLALVARSIAEVTKHNLVYDDDLLAGHTVTLVGPGPVTPQQAWDLLVALLEEEGLHLERLGTFWLITEKHNPTLSPPSHRLTPVYQGDAILGFRVHGIPSSSTLRALGFRNGDILLAVDDVPVTRPQHVWSLYEALDDRTQPVRVDIKRRGAPHTLVFR